jgi:hypothetical protein
MLLWPFLSEIPIFEAKPLFLIHPLFALEIMILYLIIIVWAFTSLFSVMNVYNQNSMSRKTIEQNILPILLVITTLVVAASGCLAFSSAPFIERSILIDCLHITYALSPPNPCSVFYGLGIILCEFVWLALVIQKYLKH